MKEIIYGDDVREKIKEGVDAVANAVKITMGPKGQHVIFEEQYGPGTATNDGVTVARQVILEDKFANIAAQKVIEAAIKTNDDSGDGTTTAVVLTQALVTEGLKNIAAGANPIHIVNGMNKACDIIVEGIKTLAIPVKNNKDIEQIATISANDADMGKLIAQAMETVGNDGIVTLEEGATAHTTLETVEGFKYDRGFLSPYMITSRERPRAEYEDCLIIIVNQKINTNADLRQIIEEAVNNKRPFLLIPERIENDPLGVITINKFHGNLQAVVTQSPSFGDRRIDVLEDIAILTGATVIADSAGVPLKDVNASHYGIAKKVIVTKEETIIIGGMGEQFKVKERVDLIRNQIKETESDFDREKFEERLARLTGGIAVINVGANTESEMKAKKYKMEDALNATKAAIAEGVVPGGGTALINCPTQWSTCEDKDARLGQDIVVEAVREPFNQIIRNAGKHPETVNSHLSLLSNREIGYDAKNDKYVDLVESGIIDPAKTVRVALENAVSIACLLLTTDCLICQKPKKEDKKNG